MSGRKFLILGANGQVGTELQRSFRDAGEVIAYDRRTADLSRPEELRGLVAKLRPDVILNAAAYTAVDRAESEPELAMTINGVAPGVLAEEARKMDAWLVHYSTDYVFDGTKQGVWLESDMPNPLNVYGKTKLAGEQAIEQAGGKYLIFRTSWVYGPYGKNFLLTMLRLGGERDQLRIVDDQIGAPTSSIAIADATRAALEKARALQAESGVYHLTCPGETTWCGFTRAIFDRYSPDAGHAWPQVIGIPSSEYPTPAQRPANSVLANGKLEAQLGVALPHWTEALDQVLGILKSVGA